MKSYQNFLDKLPAKEIVFDYLANHWMELLIPDNIIGIFSELKLFAWKNNYKFYFSIANNVPLNCFLVKFYENGLHIFLTHKKHDLIFWGYRYVEIEIDSSNKYLVIDDISQLKNIKELVPSIDAKVKNIAIKKLEKIKKDLLIIGIPYYIHNETIPGADDISIEIYNGSALIMFIIKDDTGFWRKTHGNIHYFNGNISTTILQAIEQCREELLSRQPLFLQDDIEMYNKSVALLKDLELKQSLLLEIESRL